MAGQKITQLSEQTSITNDDLFVVVENTSGATKKVQAQNILPAGSVGTADLADSSVTTAKMGLAPSTDANGWKVYDYGGFKVYKKRTTYSQAFVSGTPVNITLSSTALPSGMSTLGSNFINMNLAQNGSAYTHQVNIEMTSTSNALVASTVTSSSTTLTGFLDWEITTA